ncbi:MAG: phosphoribosylanthranilate isomerase, partial [Alphaproteobacteria bacterium]|nr:phosphoribosylanthranilate isomerase [Alphaproteobacteria bacterium]
DMVGFAHFSRSPRHLELSEIGELISYAGGRIQTCVLLVDPDDDLIVSVEQLEADWVQLHGRETVGRVEQINKITKGRVMKAGGISSSCDVVRLTRYFGAADRLLLDARPPAGADRPGGLGLPFDWSVLGDIDRGVQFMLAGGLTPENVAGAIQQVRPGGVDVSSGVESAPGIKSEPAIVRFVQAARLADRGI